MKKQIVTVLMVVGVLALGQAQAASEQDWLGGTGNYADPNFWSGAAVPVAGDWAVINNGSASVAIDANQAAYNVYVGADRDPNTDSFTGTGYSSNNTLTISGASTTVDVGNRLFLSMNGYYNPIGGDYNKLIVTDGATLNVGGRITSGRDWDYADPASAFHNEVLVQNGATINFTSAYDNTIMMYGGDLIVDNGTINSAGYVYAYSQSAAVSGQYMFLLKKGLVSAVGLEGGYGVGALRIGDGVGASGEARVHLTDELFSGGGYASAQTPIDPYDPNGPKYPYGIGVVVKSDGIVSGTPYLRPDSYEAAAAFTMLIESGGQIDPGAIDNSTAGVMTHDGGTLKFASGGILDVDLFSAVSNDKLLSGTGADFFTLDSGAILNVRKQGSYIPLPGDSWDVLGYATRTGEFTVQNSTGKAGLQFSMDYNDTAGAGTLSATAVGGDADLDGKVDGSDLAIMATNWLGAGNWLLANFNGDAVINGSDLAIMATNWNYGVSDGSPVPEPTTLILLGLGAVTLIRRRRAA